MHYIYKKSNRPSILHDAGICSIHDQEKSIDLMDKAKKKLSIFILGVFCSLAGIGGIINTLTWYHFLYLLFFFLLSERNCLLMSQMKVRYFRLCKVPSKFLKTLAG